VSAGTAGPRLLIYSQDGLGLGHLRRTTLLAAECLVAEPAGSVLTICDSPLGQFFTKARGHDYLKLPSIRKIRPGEWSPISLAQPFGEVLQMRKDIIKAAALAHRPDVLLVDHMPHGAMGELVPTLEALHGTDTRVVLGLRDILDAPETIRRRWQLEGAVAAVEEHFDDVLVYGSRDVFDVADEYQWPMPIRDRLHYCGYVCSPPTAGPAEAIRRRYVGEARDLELVVAMAGGGADAAELFNTLVRTAPLLFSSRRCALVVITGPFFPPAERARLSALAGGRVTVVPSVPDAMAHMRAADLVVAMAGYNTTAEILSTRTRALLVPRPGPSAEQRMRASRFAARGWVRWLPPERLSEQALAGAILAALDAPPHTIRLGPDLGGRRRAALHLLNGRYRAAAAARSDVTATGPAALVGVGVGAIASAPALAEAVPVDTRGTPAPILRGSGP
jgi:predicted glycosyltransferase